MDFLGTCLFVVWILFVVAVGVAFLVWGWKRGEFRIATSGTKPKPQNSETDAARQGSSIDYSEHVVAFKT